MNGSASRLWIRALLGIITLLPLTGCGGGGNNNANPATTPAPCTCGCKDSDAMIDSLRKQGGPAALDTIDQALAEIADREQKGLATEKMMAHRQRLQDLALELKSLR